MLGTVESGTYVSSTGVTVGEFLEQWKNMRTQVRRSTWHGYKVMVKRLVKQLGAVKLQALTPLQSSRRTRGCRSPAAATVGRSLRRRSATATSCCTAR